MELNVVFAAFEKSARGDGVTADEFVTVMSGLHLFLRGGEAMLRGLFASLDIDGNGSISIEELTAGIALFTKEPKIPTCNPNPQPGTLTLDCFPQGSRAEKLALCFNIYDADRSGGISWDELGRLFKALAAHPTTLPNGVVTHPRWPCATRQRS